VPPENLQAWIWVLAAAPFIGSFLGVLVRRLPRGRSVAWARSACETCGTTLGACELVPLVSYAALRGRCRHCGAPIGRFHLAIELAALAVAAIAVLIEPDPARLWLDCGLGWTLLALAWIDATDMLLPDLLTLPLLLAGLGVTWLGAPAAESLIAPDAAPLHAAAAALGYGLFRGIAVFYHGLRGREGLGAGDAKLLAAAGAWLGLQPLTWVIVGAALLGIAWALLAAWFGGQRLRGETRLPFGPALALSFWVVWLVLGHVNPPW